MSKRTRIAVVGICCFAVCVVVLVLYHRPKHFDKRFSGTTAITLVSFPKGHEGEEGTQRALKLDSRQVQSIVSEIDLCPKEACDCAHWSKLIFTTPRGQVTVSFCDHCFDIVQGQDWELYKMPAPLWTKLKPIVDRLRE